MKHDNGMFRRCLSMLLAVALVITGTGFNSIDHVHAEEGTNVYLHNLIVSNYDGKLSDAEKTIITSGALSADEIFTYKTPGDEDELITVDEEGKVVTAKPFIDTVNGHTWIPLSFDLKEGERVIDDHDDIALIKNGDVYEGSYTTTLNHFSVEVTYVLNIKVDVDTQEVILNAGKLLGDDISDMKYLNDVSIFPAKPHAYEALESQIQQLIKDMMADKGLTVPQGDLKITPELVMMYLTMDIDGENSSAVDELNKLTTRTDVVLPDGTDLGYFGLLSKDAKNAAASLYGQKATGLKLYNNIVANASKSYLEWLLTDTQKLEDALSSNYNDLNYLANNSQGLKRVSQQIEDILLLLEEYIVEAASSNGYPEIDSIEAFEEKLIEVQAQRDEALIELNDALGAYGYKEKVTNSEDLQDAIGWLDANRKSLFETVLKDELAKNDLTLDDLNDLLEEFGCPHKITIANYTADMTAAVEWLDANRDSIFATALEAELAKKDLTLDDLNDLLHGFGYGGNITVANYTADMTAAIEWLDTNRNSIFETALSEALAQYDLTLADLNAKLASYGYTGSITAANYTAEMSAAIEWLSLNRAEIFESVLNEELAKNDLTLANLNAKLASYGYTGSITAANYTADMNAAIEWLNENRAGIFESVLNEELAKNDLTLADLNGKLASYGYTGSITAVNYTEDMSAAIEWLTNNKNSIFETALNEELAKNGLTLAKLNDMLASYGYPASITVVNYTNDMTNAINWLTNNKTYVFGRVLDQALAEKGLSLAGLNSMLAEYGYSGEITVANYTVDMTAAINWLTAEKPNLFEQVVDENLVELNAVLSELGYTGTVSAATYATDIDNAIAYASADDGMLAYLCEQINNKMQTILTPVELAALKWTGKYPVTDRAGIEDLRSVLATLNRNGQISEQNYTAADAALANVLEALDTTVPTLNEVKATIAEAEVAFDAQFDEKIAALNEAKGAEEAFNTEFDSSLAKLNEAKGAKETFDIEFNRNMELLVEAKGAKETFDAEFDKNMELLVEAKDAKEIFNTEFDKNVDLLEDAKGAREEFNAEFDEKLALLQEAQGAKEEFNALFDEKLALLREAQGAETLFNNEFDQKLAELDEAKELLSMVEMLETAKKELDDARQKQQMLEMVIIIMQLLCENLKVANDNFVNDTWNALNILDASKITNYKALNDAAAGLTTTPDVEITDTLFVDETKVLYNLSMYNVTVQIQAKKVDPSKVDSVDMIDLPAYNAKSFTMRKDSTAEQIREEINKILADAKTAAKAQESWEDAKVTEADYNCEVVTVLPDALNSDLTYVVLYSPKNYTLTFDGFTVDEKTELSVPYGYRFALPAHADEMLEYIYTVDTEENIDQKTVVTVTKNVTISRKEGKASEKQTFNTLVAETILKEQSGILLNGAVAQKGSVSITLPDKENVTVIKHPSGIGVLITAMEAESRVGDEKWAAERGYLVLEDDSIVNFDLDENGQYVTEEIFKFVYVTYELQLTAAGLGVDDAELLQVINIPYTLKTDYDNQKKALDGLAAKQPYLKKLNNNSSEAVEIAGKSYTVKGLLGALNSLKDFFGLSDIAVQKAAELAALIPEAEGTYLPLCNTLDNYNSEGMINFYKNEVTYLTQINQLYDLLTALVDDQSLMSLLAENGYDAMFNESKNALEEAYKLNNEYAIDKDLIIVSDEELPALLEELANASVEKYASVPADMTWTHEVQGTPPGMKKITLTVRFQGKTATDTWSVGEGDVLSEQDIANRIESMLDTVGMTDEVEKHYIRNISEYDAIVLEDTTIEVTWAAKNYNVVVAGNLMGTVTIAGGNLGKLPVHTNGDYAYTYYVGGTVIPQGEDLIFTSAMVADLVDANGVITVTRTETNVAEKSLIASANALGLVLTKDENGKYAMVLPIDGTSQETLTESLMNFMLGQIGNETIIGGEPFFDGKFHLQTLIDVLMNSGLSTESIKNMVEEDGSVVNDLFVEESAILGDVTGEAVDGSNQVALGATLAESTLGLNKKTYDFYITIVGSGAMLRDLVSGLDEAGVQIALEDGAATLTIEISDEYYGIYAAALTMVGEADIKDINAINGSVAFGYLFDLLNPVLSDPNVDLGTIGNTIGQFGFVADLSDYEAIYDRLAAYLNSNDVEYTENACKLALTDLNINSLVDSMSEGFELPDALGDVTLGSLVYEYQEEGETEDQYGIDLNVAAGLTNIDKTYVALAIDATNRKIFMVTEEDLATIADAQLVVLLDNIGTDAEPVALNLNGAVLDLNGKTVNGSVTGAELRIVDNEFSADVPGKVTGDVNVAAVIGGAYNADVTAMLPNGYVQEKGIVRNVLYTITRDGDTTTVALNPTTVVAKLANKEDVAVLGIELAVDILMNYYNTASLAVNGNEAVMDMQLSNLGNLLTGEGRLNNALEQALGCVSAPAMAALINDIVAALTDFATMNEALGAEGDGVICTFDTVIAPWKLEILPATDGDYLAINIFASDATEAGKLVFAIDGDGSEQDKTEDLEILTGALADTTKVTSELIMEEIKIVDSAIVVNGGYNGSVEIDFTNDPEYVVMMAVILAKGNASIREDLVAGIKDYCEEKNADGTVRYENPEVLKAAFDKLTIGQIDKALGNIARTDSFSEMVEALGLTDYVSDALAADDTAKGFDLIVDVLGFIMRRVEKESNSRTLGGAQLDGEYGVYGLDYSGTFEGTKELSYGKYSLGYDLAYNFAVGEVDVTVKLFNEHTCTPDTKIENDKPATCTTDHSYDEVVYCTVCNKEIGRETITEEGTALDHNWVRDEQNDVAITWDNDGELAYVCDRGDCDETKTETVSRHPVTINMEGAFSAGYNTLEDAFAAINSGEIGNGVAYPMTAAANVYRLRAVVPTVDAQVRVTKEVDLNSKINLDKVVNVVVEDTGKVNVNQVDGENAGFVLSEGAVMTANTNIGDCYSFDAQQYNGVIDVNGNDHSYSLEVLDVWVYAGVGVIYGFDGADALDEAIAFALTNDYIDVQLNAASTLSQDVILDDQSLYIDNAHLMSIADGKKFVVSEDCNLIFGVSDEMDGELNTNAIKAALEVNSEAPDCAIITYQEDTATYLVVTVGYDHVAGTAVRENERAATCMKPGHYDSVVYCTKCDKEISRETIDIPEEPSNPDAHVPGTAVEENRVESTCTTPGSYDAVIYCTETGCGRELSRDHHDLPLDPNAHVAGTAVEENRVASTCKTQGGYDMVVYCSESGCGEELSRNHYELPLDPEAHVAGSAVEENRVGATCTTPGSYDSVVYCTETGCGAELSRTNIITDPATNHAYKFTYTWNDADYTCKATVTCTKCVNVNAIVDCTVVKATYSDRDEYTATAVYDGVTNSSDPLKVYFPPEVSDPTIIEGGQAAEHVYGWVAQKVEDVPNADTIPGVEKIDGILTLDKVSDGITIAELENILAATVKNDADGKAEFHFYVNGVEITDLNARVVNGSVLDVVAENAAGQKAIVSWLIIVSGDTNCNGRVEAGDAVRMWRHFQGIELMTGVELMAADTNHNGRIDSGDAVKNTLKYQNADGYISSLPKND